MKVLDDGRLQVRVKITGTFRGQPWEYTDPDTREGSQFLWPPGSHDDYGDDEINAREWGNSYYWWASGNLACDCNRAKFLPPEMFFALYGVSIEEMTLSDFRCGDEILIDEIVPIEGDIRPALCLNETDNSKGAIT